MGTLIYGGSERRICFDDRTLAHIKSVVVTKLRRHEAFTLSWVSEENPSGRVSIWIHPSIPMGFEFDGAERPAINRAWLMNMMVSSMTSGDVQVEREPVAVAA